MCGQITMMKKNCWYLFCQERWIHHPKHQSKTIFQISAFKGERHFPTTTKRNVFFSAEVSSLFSLFDDIWLLAPWLCFSFRQTLQHPCSPTNRRLHKGEDEEEEGRKEAALSKSIKTFLLLFLPAEERKEGVEGEEAAVRNFPGLTLMKARELGKKATVVVVSTSLPHLLGWGKEKEKLFGRRVFSWRRHSIFFPRPSW